MADSPQPPDNVPPPAPIGQALQDVAETTHLLIREEIELAKAEMEQTVKTLVRGSAVGVAAGVFVAVGLLFVLHGLAWLAYWVLPFPNGAFFWGFFMVAAGLFITAGLAGLVAYKAFSSSKSPLPKMAMEEAQLIRQTVTSPDPTSTVPESKP